LDAIHKITSTHHYQLVIKAEDFANETYTGTYKSVKFLIFLHTYIRNLAVTLCLFVLSLSSYNKKAKKYGGALDVYSEVVLSALTQELRFTSCPIASKTSSHCCFKDFLSINLLLAQNHQEEGWLSKRVLSKDGTAQQE